jgi:hypothetical protein
MRERFSTRAVSCAAKALISFADFLTQLRQHVSLRPRESCHRCNYSFLDKESYWKDQYERSLAKRNELQTIVQQLKHTLHCSGINGDLEPESHLTRQADKIISPEAAEPPQKIKQRKILASKARVRQETLRKETPLPTSDSSMYNARAQDVADSEKG